MRGAVMRRSLAAVAVVVGVLLVATDPSFGWDKAESAGASRSSRVARANQAASGQQPPEVTVQPTTATPGQEVTVTVTDGSGNPRDWVGLYRGDRLVAWRYLNGTKRAPRTAEQVATLTFVMPKRAGVYEFRLYADNAFTVVLATSAPVTIASASMPAGAPPTASPPATAPTPTPAPPASPQASPPPSVPTPAPLPPQASPSPPLQASGLPKGDCSSEGSLAARTDIVFCEPWERRDW